MDCHKIVDGAAWYTIDCVHAPEWMASVRLGADADRVEAGHRRHLIRVHGTANPMACPPDKPCPSAGEPAILTFKA